MPSRRHRQEGEAGAANMGVLAVASLGEFLTRFKQISPVTCDEDFHDASGVEELHDILTHGSCMLVALVGIACKGLCDDVCKSLRYIVFL